MHAHGCHIITLLNADSEEGFCATVCKWAHKNVEIPVEDRVTVGPINSIRLAILYAKEWADVDNPPELPKPWVDPAKVIVESRTVEVENFTLQIDNAVSEPEPPKE